MTESPDVAGVREFVEWFGSWPTFHDAEVTRIHLNRSGASYIDVHVFRMTSQISSTGHYVCDQHAVVTFEIEGILSMEMVDFNRQNVVSGIAVSRTDAGITKLVLGGCYGAQGFLEAEKMSVTFKLGTPDDSQYRNLAI